MFSIPIAFLISFLNHRVFIHILNPFNIFLTIILYLETERFCLTFLYFWKQMYSTGGSVPRNEFILISPGLNFRNRKVLRVYEFLRLSFRNDFQSVLDLFQPRLYIQKFYSRQKFIKI